MDDDKENWIDRHHALATDGSFNLHIMVADGRVGVLSREFPVPEDDPDQEAKRRDRQKRARRSGSGRFAEGLMGEH